MLFEPDESTIAAITEQRAAYSRINEIRDCANEQVEKAMAPRIEALRKIMSDAGYKNLTIEAYCDQTGRVSFTLAMLEVYADGT